LAIVSYANGGLLYDLVRGDLAAAVKVERVRHFVLGFGRAAGLVYLLSVIAEVVVAPIPGALLYAPGGMLFGGFWGGALTLLGNTLGAGLACRIARSLAADRVAAWAGPWSGHPKLGRLREAARGRGFWVVMLLRLNPLTSSDLVSYAAGLTSIPTWQVMAGTCVGMAPLCFLQAHFAHRLLESVPALLYPAIGLCVLYVGICAWLLLRGPRGELMEPGPQAADL
jgi:uncharacterized membrane protein YdjX (TVP38/TMEM64 family)